MKIFAILLDVICSANEIYWLYKWVNIFFDKKSFFQKNTVIKAEWLLILLYMILVFGLNNIALTSPWTMIIVFIINFAAIMIFWKCDFVESFAASGGYFLSIFMLGNIEISLTGILGGEKLIYATTQERGLIRIVYLIMGGSLWFIINKGMTTYVKKKKGRIQGWGYIAGVSAFGLMGSAFLGTMLLNNFDKYINAAWYFFLVVFLFVIFSAYFIVNLKDERLKMTILTAQNEMLERNYKQANEFYTANAKLYHDMHHHFDVVYHMLQEGKQEKAKEYLKGICSDDKKSEIIFQSGINVLDAVLYDMNLRAQKKGILFTVETEILPCDLGIEDRDICSLFANLLENAIEASINKVEIRINKINHTIYATISNDYVIEPIKKGKNFVTQKKDKSLHGWGTKIVDQIIEKYEGSIEYEIKDGNFNVYIMLNEAD